MEMDDRKRAADGVVACIRDEGDELRLIFDDVESETRENRYQEIGFNLMARLGAIYKTKKRIKSDD